MEAWGGRAQAACSKGATSDWLWRNPCGCPEQSIIVSVATWAQGLWQGRRGDERGLWMAVVAVGRQG